MVEGNAVVKNKLGIHARPSGLLVQGASKFASEIALIRDGLEVNGKSIMGVMMLAAEAGAEIGIRVDGDDEEEAFAKVIELIEAIYD